MEAIGDFIATALNHVNDEAALRSIADQVGDLCKKFPVYPHRLGKR